VDEADFECRTAETRGFLWQGDEQWRLPRKVSRAGPVSHYGHHKSDLWMCEWDERHGVGARATKGAARRRHMEAANVGHTSGVLLNIAERQLTMTRKRAMPLKKCSIKGVLMIEDCIMEIMPYHLGLELLPNA
jgi:hypothetical protein